MGLIKAGRLDTLLSWLATGFYISYIPVRKGPAPNRWTGAGSLGAAEGWVLLRFLPENPVCFSIFLAVAVALACWICGRAEKILGRVDDQRIVLDEIVGFWTSVAFLPRTWQVSAIAFCLFRVLDCVKVPPCRWLERLKGGLGVVGDDVGAALIANLLVRVVMNCWPSLFL